MNPSTPVHSKKISQLISDLKNNPKAINNFCVKTSFPLIEPGKHHGSNIVTFVWIDDKTTESVAFYSEVNPSQALLPMSKIENTSFFYLTFEIANDVRLAYAFLPNVNISWHDDLNIRMAELRKLMPKFQPDPHNPNQHLAGGTSILFSILEMPQASTNFLYYQKTESLKGIVRSHSIESQIYQQGRKFYIYTPHNYDASKKYEMLLLLDGQMYSESGMNLSLILDNLIAHEKINPIIAIFVDSMNISEREQDLLLSEELTKFLEIELLPMINNSYSIAKDPAKHIIAGASLGGTFALYFAIKNPHLFQNILINSGAFWCNIKKLEDLIKLMNKLNLKIYMDYGSLEDPSLMKELNLKYVDKLSQLGCFIKSQEFPGGHNYYCWRETIGEALEFLVPIDT